LQASKLSKIEESLLSVYRESLLPQFMGGLRVWAEDNINLPPAYAIPGRVDLSISPYLLSPAQAMTDPRIMQVNLCMATQVGKSFLSELFVPYIVTEAPGPMMRIFHNESVSDLFTSDRLVPMLKNCPPIKPLLQFDRYSTSKKGVHMPHMSIVCGSANAALQHGLSIRYLLCDELHEWEPGQFRKFLARTTAFAGRRKIICASQPGRTGSEWEGITYSGIVYDWQWLCPKCLTRQPFHWSKEKPGGYAGFNCDKVLLSDGETRNIAESSKNTWLECEKCDHRVQDTPTERRL
jgi:phage terminase large subunit GpA-like protein